MRNEETRKREEWRVEFYILREVLALKKFVVFLVSFHAMCSSLLGLNEFVVLNQKDLAFSITGKTSELEELERATSALNFSLFSEPVHSAFGLRHALWPTSVRGEEWKPSSPFLSIVYLNNLRSGWQKWKLMKRKLIEFRLKLVCLYFFLELIESDFQSDLWQNLAYRTDVRTGNFSK